MLKKILLIPMLAFLCACPLFQTSAANKSEITNIKVATRTDSAKPFVRTVLEVTAPVKPKIAFDKNGKYFTVSLPYTSVQKSIPKSLKTNKNVITQLSVAPHLYSTDINFKVPNSLSRNDVKVFSLPNDIRNKRPNRIVIDVNDKSGSVRTWQRWKEQEDDRDSGITPVNESTYSFPSNNRAYTFSLQPGLRGKTICIDPGHGGTDSGALGAYSKEKDITLAIAEDLKDLLTKAGAKVIMTRTTDVDVYAPNDGAVEELQARCDIANNANADAFVCIHIDSFSSSSATGVTAYYNSKTSYDYSLAKYIHTENMKYASSMDRGVKTANFYVLLHTNMPATLLELGFISNPGEEKLLNTTSLQKRYAGSIYDGLANYFDNKGR